MNAVCLKTVSRTKNSKDFAANFPFPKLGTRLASILGLCLLTAIPCLAENTNDTPLPKPASKGIEVSLWPTGKMPTYDSGVSPEALLEKNYVTEPILTVYQAPTPNTGKDLPSMVVCPGGGYNHLAYDKEGLEVAAWLNSIGITAAVLKYRIPGRDGAFQDVQRAMRLLRAHAKEWKVDPAHCGIIGFSAGGHLSARLSNNYEKPAYAAVDEADQLSCKPDFTVLVYPAYLQIGGKVAPETAPTAATPPTFIVHTEDDKAYVEGSKIYTAELEKAGVPHEYFLCPAGGHGYGLRLSDKNDDLKSWPERCHQWLQKVVPL